MKMPESSSYNERDKQEVKNWGVMSSGSPIVFYALCKHHAELEEWHITAPLQRENN